MDPRPITMRKLSLKDHKEDSGIPGLSAAERISLMWQLALDAWAFSRGPDPDSPMRRDIVRILRLKS
jgi:hypothetical protein